MSFRDRLKTAALFLIGGQKGVVGLEYGAQGSEYQVSADFETLSKEGYEKNAIIYACINELASSASEADLIVEAQTKKGWEERPDHPLKRLLDKPHPEMSAYDFWFMGIVYESLAGNMFYEKERSKAGRVVGLWPMRPDRVGIIAAKSVPGQRIKRRIQAYTWRSGSDTVQLPARDVIQFKHLHPRDELYGLPPLAAAAREGDTDNKATDYVGSFFNNAAVPKGLLRVTGYIDTAEEKRLRERLVNMYTGSGGWHNPLILGEGSEWIELAETFKDMDFPNLRKISETRLCMVFQVPPILIGAFAGLERSTFSNVQESRRSFWQDTLMPSYRRREDVINRDLAPEFGADVRVRWDFSKVKALQEEVEKVWQRANEGMERGYLTVNEARVMVGLEEDPAGNIYLRPVMIMPAPFGQAAEAPQLAGTKEVKSAQVPEEVKERWARTIDQTAQAWEGPFRKAAADLFSDEKAELVKILRREGKAAKQSIAYQAFLNEGVTYLVVNKKGWQQAFLGLFGGLMKAQLENVEAVYGIAWDIERPEVQQFLAGYTMKFAEGIEGVSEHALRELVMKAQSEGWSVTQTREAIMQTWEGFSEQRAQMIARTETIRSSNYGVKEAWKQGGITKISWYTYFDGRECGWCTQMHGKTIAIENNFANMGDELMSEEGEIMTVTYSDVGAPPLHPNCRCTELAVVE